MKRWRRRRSPWCPCTSGWWRTLATCCRSGARDLPQPRRAERNLEDLDLFRRHPERVLERLREERSDRDRAVLAAALDAARLSRRLPPPAPAPIPRHLAPQLHHAP